MYRIPVTPRNASHTHFTAILPDRALLLHQYIPDGADLRAHGAAVAFFIDRYTPVGKRNQFIILFLSILGLLCLLLQIHHVETPEHKIHRTHEII